MFIAFYVDDIIFMENNAEIIMEFKSVMKKEFEITYLGHMKYFLGFEVKQYHSTYTTLVQTTID